MHPAQLTAVLNPDVLCTALPNGDSVLLHLGTQTYYSLNETGTQIWQLAGQGLTLEAIGQAIEARYEVTPDLARQSVIELTASLAAERLLELLPPR
jgi:hypothetical protein